MNTFRPIDPKSGLPANNPFTPQPQGNQTSSTPVLGAGTQMGIDNFKQNYLGQTVKAPTTTMGTTTPTSGQPTQASYTGKRMVTKAEIQNLFNNKPEDITYEDILMSLEAKGYEIEGMEEADRIYQESLKYAKEDMEEPMEDTLGESSIDVNSFGDNLKMASSEDISFQEAFKDLGKFGVNIPGDTAEAVEEIYGLISSPLETIQGLVGVAGGIQGKADLAVGGFLAKLGELTTLPIGTEEQQKQTQEKWNRLRQEGFLGVGGYTEDERQLIDSIKTEVIDKYGTPGKFKKALVENPVDTLLAIKGLSSAINKFAKAKGLTKLEKASATISNLALKPVTAPLTGLTTAGKKIGEFGVRQLTGLDLDTIKTVYKNPKLYEQARNLLIDRPKLGEKVLKNIDKKIQEVSGLGKEYQTIRQSVDLIDSTPIQKGLNDSLTNRGIKVVNGKLDFTDSNIGNTSSKTAIQNAYDEVNAILNKGQIVANDVLNMRNKLDDIIDYNAQVPKKGQEIIKNIRSTVDDIAKESIPALKELDKKFGPEIRELNQIKRMFIDKETGKLKDSAFSAIANLIGKGKEQKLALVEKMIPGITDEIKALKAFDDVELAGGQKVGTYIRGGVVGGGVATANPLLIGLGVLTSPQIIVPLIENAGKLKKKAQSFINSIKNKIKTGKKLDKQEAVFVSQVIEDNFDTKALPYREGMDNIGPGMKFNKIEPFDNPLFPTRGGGITTTEYKNMIGKPDVKPKFNKVGGEKELLAEAKKYKTADEFIEKQMYNPPKYGISHRPTFEGSPPAHNLLEGDMLPRDVYSKPEGSIASGRNIKTDISARESWNALQKIKGNPEAEITVYRASPKDELNVGDWVSFSKTYAEGEGVSEGTKAFAHKVKAKDIYFAGDDINEFGYFPKERLKQIREQANKGLDKVEVTTVSKDLISEARKYKTADEMIKGLEEKGEIVYHGTPEGGFDNFSKDFKGVRTGHKPDEVGFHFTDNKDYAESYSEGYKIKNWLKVKEKNPNVLPRKDLPKNPMIYKVYLDYKNPYNIGASKNITTQTIKNIQNQGYDSIIADHGGGKEIVVFEPSQIKTEAQLKKIREQANKGLDKVEVTTVSKDFIKNNKKETFISRFGEDYKKIINNKIGEGATADVYDLGNGNIIKVANNRDFIYYNFEPIEILEEKGFLPKTKEVGFNYRIVEKVKTYDELTDKNKAKIDDFINDIESIKYNDPWDTYYELLEKYDLEYLSEYLDPSTLTDDVGYKRNLTIKNGKIMLIDEGALKLIDNDKTTVDEYLKFIKEKSGGIDSGYEFY